jgi:hypothetical protein
MGYTQKKRGGAGRPLLGVFAQRLKAERLREEKLKEAKRIEAEKLKEQYKKN